MSNTSGHNHKVRGAGFIGNVRSKCFFYIEGGRCLECVARDGGESIYNSGVQETFGQAHGYAGNGSCAGRRVDLGIVFGTDIMG